VYYCSVSGGVAKNFTLRVDHAPSATAVETSVKQVGTIYSTFIYSCVTKCQTSGHHLHSSIVVVPSVQQVGTIFIHLIVVVASVKQVGIVYLIPQLWSPVPNRWALFTFIHNCRGQSQTGGHCLPYSTLVELSIKKVGSVYLHLEFLIPVSNSWALLTFISSIAVVPFYNQVGKFFDHNW
jgi:hypothetical protein